jgi:Flp pilus assembly protein TadD
VRSKVALSVYLSILAAALAICAQQSQGSAAVASIATLAAVAPAGVLRQRGRHSADDPAASGTPAGASAFDRGFALASDGRYEDAVRALRRAVVDDPADADAHFHLGVALTELGCHADAVAPLRAAAQLRPLDALAHHRLGVALARVGRTDDAITALGEAIRLNPTMPDAHRLLDLALRARRQGTVEPADAMPGLAPSVVQLERPVGARQGVCRRTAALQRPGQHAARRRP